MCRARRSIPAKTKPNHTQEVIRELSLESCADSLIGTELVRGISGGERKRTMLGRELVTDPRLLFLDEVRGLDDDDDEPVGWWFSGVQTGGCRLCRLTRHTCVPLARPRGQPTTGLDAKTAGKVAEILACLAREKGKTVVLSIHQVGRHDHHVSCLVFG